jgi:hypothetical protein
MNATATQFPKELLKQVKAGLNQRGFHVLERNALQQICRFGISGSEKLQLVHQFATQCGAECEIGLDFAAARFLPKRFAKMDPQIVRLLRIADLEGVPERPAVTPRRCLRPLLRAGKRTSLSSSRRRK